MREFSARYQGACALPDEFSDGGIDQFGRLHDGFIHLALRHPQLGHWCGYVGVPPHHRLWKCSNVPREFSFSGTGPRLHKHGAVDKLDAHGGITFIGHPHFDKKTRNRLKTLQKGAKHWWFFGFDCAHLFDVMPTDQYRGLAGDGATYKNLGYVLDEIEQLQEQLCF